MFLSNSIFKGVHEYSFRKIFRKVDLYFRKILLLKKFILKFIINTCVKFM